MRRLLWGFGLAFIPACGLISGLGDLELEGVDAGVDAVAEKSPADVVAEAALDATAVPDTSPVLDASAPDTSPVLDASVPDVAKDTGSLPDAGGDASTGIQCGAAPKTCTLSSPTCCFDALAKTYACGASACISPTVAVECDFDSCGSTQVCCRRTQPPSVKCESTAQCPGTASQVVWICNPLAPVCPLGKTCQPSQLLPGYSVCL